MKKKFQELFSMFQSMDDADMLISWIEAIEESQIAHGFTIEEMQNFDSTMDAKQLKEIISLGESILNEND